MSESVEVGREENRDSNFVFVPQCCRIRDSRTAIIIELTFRKSKEDMLSTMRGRPDD
jgi:hypothetical protein